MRHSLVLIIFTALVGVLGLMPSVAHAQSEATLPIMSATELSQFNGQNGNRAYFAYEGVVYDVTDSNSWQNGDHFGVFAGKDLTGQMGGAPHGTEVFEGFPKVATLASTSESSELTTSPAVTETQSPVAASTQKKWYEGRIRIFGLSVLGWSGILMGVFFVLNFATCFALPWTKLPLPWKGNRPGPDTLDAAENSLRWGSFHKQFAWLTVIFGIIHGVLGFLQMLGYYL